MRLHAVQGRNPLASPVSATQAVACVHVVSINMFIDSSSCCHLACRGGSSRPPGWSPATALDATGFPAAAAAAEAGGSAPAEAPFRPPAARAAWASAGPPGPGARAVPAEAGAPGRRGAGWPCRLPAKRRQALSLKLCPLFASPDHTSNTVAFCKTPAQRETGSLGGVGGCSCPHGGLANHALGPPAG